MKHLTIVYGDTTLFDSDVEEMAWTDSGNGVSVTAKITKTVGGGLMDLLTAASRTVTDTKKRELSTNGDTSTD